MGPRRGHEPGVPGAFPGSRSDRALAAQLSGAAGDRAADWPQRIAVHGVLRRFPGPLQGLPRRQHVSGRCGWHAARLSFWHERSGQALRRARGHPADPAPAALAQRAAPAADRPCRARGGLRRGGRCVLSVLPAGRRQASAARPQGACADGGAGRARAGGAARPPGADRRGRAGPAAVERLQPVRGAPPPVAPTDSRGARCICWPIPSGRRRGCSSGSA